MKTLLVLLCAGSLALTANAQTTKQSTNTQQPTTQRPVGVRPPLMINDSIGRALNLRQDQMTWWKERGTFYEKEYGALTPGDTYDRDRKAWMDRRDLELKGYLTPEQYERWNTMNRNHMGTVKTPADNPTTPNTPAPQR